MVVCPLVGPNVVSCCPLPVDTVDAVPVCCVSGGPACQPSLTISASPDPLTAGARVTLSGALLRGSGAGTSVTLWQQQPGQGKPSQAGASTTDIAGNWSITLPAGSVMTDRSWYATADGVTSSTISEPVSAIVTLLASRGRHGATLHGSVMPSHVGERILLQRLVAGHWVTVARPRLGQRSLFRIHVRLHGKLQALLRADSLNALSISPELKL
jgi:hypothetical protein